MTKERLADAEYRDREEMERSVQRLADEIFGAYNTDGLKDHEIVLYATKKIKMLKWMVTNLEDSVTPDFLDKLMKDFE